MEQRVFTIGHSTHQQARFVALLKGHDITAVCDVRSAPYSRINPQFNREELKRVLRESGIAYVFLGKELGARSDDPSCYDQGRVQYGRLARTGLFQRGLERIQEGMRKYRIALMCAEKEPLDCHRTILVARYLVPLHIDVQHIHADGTLEGHGDALGRLVEAFGLREGDMFRSQEDQIADAYLLQEQRIAYEPGAAGAPLRSAMK